MHTAPQDSTTGRPRRALDSAWPREASNPLVGGHRVLGTPHWSGRVAAAADIHREARGTFFWKVNEPQGSVWPRVPWTVFQPRPSSPRPSASWAGRLRTAEDGGRQRPALPLSAFGLTICHLEAQPATLPGLPREPICAGHCVGDVTPRRPSPSESEGRPDQSRRSPGQAARLGGDEGKCVWHRQHRL